MSVTTSVIHICALVKLAEAVEARVRAPLINFFRLYACLRVFINVTNFTCRVFNQDRESKWVPLNDEYGLSVNHGLSLSASKSPLSIGVFKALVCFRD